MQKYSAFCEFHLFRETGLGASWPAFIWVDCFLGLLYSCHPGISLYYYYLLFPLTSSRSGPPFLRHHVLLFSWFTTPLIWWTHYLVAFLRMHMGNKFWNYISENVFLFYPHTHLSKTNKFSSKIFKFYSIFSTVCGIPKAILIPDPSYNAFSLLEELTQSSLWCVPKISRWCPFCRSILIHC